MMTFNAIKYEIEAFPFAQQPHSLFQYFDDMMMCIYTKDNEEGYNHHED